MEDQGKNDPFGIGAEMAEEIAKILQEKGSCEPRELEAKGFSSKDVRRHWRMAYALAKVKLNWTDA
ncbi:MAG TPA: hypothetical protein DD400_01065 [Rhodospirillaceae bacterium]|nr:hypothetical protein [Rhodospirillaceae bacterium]